MAPWLLNVLCTVVGMVKHRLILGYVTHVAGIKVYFYLATVITNLLVSATLLSSDPLTTLCFVREK